MASFADPADAFSEEIEKETTYITSASTRIHPPPITFSRELEEPDTKPSPRSFMVMGLCSSEEFESWDYGSYGALMRRLDKVLSATTADSIEGVHISLLQSCSTYRVFEQVILDAFGDFGINLSSRLGMKAGDEEVALAAVATGDRNTLLRLLLGESAFSHLSNNGLSLKSAEDHGPSTEAEKILTCAVNWFEKLLNDPRLDSTTLADVRFNKLVLQRRIDSGMKPAIIVRELLLQTVMSTRLYLSGRV